MANQQQGVSPETNIERYERYNAAYGRMMQWGDILEAVYRYANPTKRDFNRIVQTEGESKTDDVYDSTAIIATDLYANNVQSILMPPGQNWFGLDAGEEIPSAERERKQAELQDATKLFFKHLNQSNFNFAINQSLRDMAISTGVLLMNQGTQDDPFKFMSAPLKNVSFEEGADQRLENFWQRWVIPGRQIKRIWPKATLSERFEKRIKDKPNDLVTLIQGTIVYPEQPEGLQIYSYVQEADTKEDILQENTNFNPWMGFRVDKAPEEIVGRGPVMMLLPEISSLNKMTEFELKAYKFRAFPPYLADTTSIVNAYNMVIEPGSIIPIKTSIGTRPAIQALEMGGDPRFGELKIEEKRKLIREILFAQPLQPDPTPGQSATEVAIREQHWIRQNTTGMGRIQRELLQNIVTNGFQILSNLGLMKPIKVDGKEATLKYESPLLDIQSQDEIRRAQQWLQGLQLVFGPQAPILVTNIEKYPAWSAEKMKVDHEIVKSTAEIEEKLKQQSQEALKQAAQGLAEQAGGVEPIPQTQPFTG